MKKIYKMEIIRGKEDINKIFINALKEKSRKNE